MRVARRLVILPVLVGMVMIAACSAAEAPPEAAGEGPYWPRFHGPDGDNKSPDTGLMKSWPEDGPPLVWTAEGIGEGYSGVTLAGGLIYTAGNKDGKTMVTALDLGGNIAWQVANGKAWTESYEGTRGTPTIDGFGPSGEGAHRVDECIVIADVPQRLALLTALVLSLALPPGDWLYP